MALEGKPIDPGIPVDERIEAAIRSRLEEGNLPCAAACELAEALGVPPAAVGLAADRLRIHLARCQLGLFRYPERGKGWEGADVAGLPVPDGLEEALAAAGHERGEISCERLWQEARRFGVTRLQVGWLADRLGLKIRDCPLGAF